MATEEWIIKCIIIRKISCHKCGSKDKFKTKKGQWVLEWDFSHGKLRYKKAKYMARGIQLIGDSTVTSIQFSQLPG